VHKRSFRKLNPCGESEQFVVHYKLAKMLIEVRETKIRAKCKLCSIFSLIKMNNEAVAFPASVKKTCLLTIQSLSI